MEIIYFEEKYYDDLLAFSKRIWPEKSEEYMEYRIYKFPEMPEDNKKNLLVLNDEGKVVGCTLMFPTRARINGIEEKIYWSHDLIVDEQYRGEAGLQLMAEISEIRTSFGFGTTELNYKIQKELGTRFIGSAKLYLLFNIWSLKAPLIMMGLMNNRKKDNLKLPDRLKAGRNIFRKISSAEELNIPDGGYWSGPETDIEFIRDKHFITKRFFENFTAYYFYKLENDDHNKPDECFFVVRPSVEGGLPVISVVDFRYNKKKPEQYKSIFKAASSLGRINRLPLVTLRTSVNFGKYSLFPMVFRREKEEYILTNYPVKENPSLFVTNADADIDFLSLS